MNEQVAIDLIRQALVTAFWISMPLLVVVFVFGIIMSLLQTLFSIQDSNFSSVPRLVAILLTFLLTLPWMMQRIIAYTMHLIASLPQYAR